MTESKLTAARLLELFGDLNRALSAKGVRGELYVVGGAVMCMVYKARPATADIDALFEPKAKVREAARTVAENHGLAEGWLNDGVKAFLSPAGEFHPHLELSHLSIYVPSAEYLLAMKCLSMRLGKEFHDEDDVRYLLRHCNLTTEAQARSVLAKYYPLDRFPQKTFYALAELLPRTD